ncbi:MAG: hypothetical protein GY842_03215 [bacterium]|nr:hypothetical protein [bacterium]
MSTQHAALTAERWARHELDSQVLMIANEMNRASKLLAAGDNERLVRCYQRVLNLLDLTVAVNTRSSLRRELLRWRDLVAQLYVSPDRALAAHRAAFRCLLLFTPAASRQIPHLLG